MKIFKKDEKPKKKHLSKAKKEKLKLKEKELAIKEKEERKEKISKLDLSPFFGGIAMGIANIIPGVSGGTMLVIFGLFERLANSISDLFKKGSTTKKQSFIFLLKIGLGAAIGIIAFAKVLGFTLEHIEAETIFWFMGLILFSVPIIYRNEMKEEKFNIIFFIIGIAIIAVLEYFNLHGGLMNTGDSNSIINYLVLVGLGVIGGISMIFPGISGSMVMLVLGKYEMIRGYIDKVTSLDINIYIKLIVFGIGAVLGVILSSKVLSKVLKNHRGKTISLILGFIIASALILPLNLETKLILSTEKICGLIVSFVLGGVLIYFLDRLENKDK